MYMYRHEREKKKETKSIVRNNGHFTTTKEKKQNGQKKPKARPREGQEMFQQGNEMILKEND